MSAEAAVVEHASGPGLKELFQLLNFLVVVAIIYFAGRKSIASMLKQRSKDVEDRLFSAKKQLEELNQQLESSQKELARLDDLKNKILKDVEDEGRVLSEKMIQEAEGQAQRILRDSKLMAENITQNAAKELRVKLVSEALEKVNESLAGDKAKSAHEKLIQGF